MSHAAGAPTRAPTPAPTPSFIVANRSNPTINAAHILHGYHAFNSGHFEEAMMFFQLTEADPLQILSLFPDVLPTGLGQPSSDPLHPSPFSALPALASQKHPIPVQKVQGEERLFRALSALIPYLAQIQNRLRLQLETLFTSPGSSTHTTPQAKSRSSTSSRQDKSSSGSSASKGDRPDPNLALAILVDTVLLKAYLLCDIPLLPFLSSPYNLCDIDECAHILRAYEKYQELVAFFKFRARHGQALELLEKLAQIGAGDNGNGNGKNASANGGGKSNGTNAKGNAHTSQSLQPASSNNASLSGLSGTEPTIKYLQELAVNIHQPCYPYSITGDAMNAADVTAAALAYSPALAQLPNPQTIISLILHFSAPILKADVDDGLRIFTWCHTMNMQPVEARRKGSFGGGSSSSSSSGLSGILNSGASVVHSYAHHRDHCIPSHIVLDHLKQAGDKEACIAYLESLINNVGETDALFHNELIFLYLESIQKLLKAQEQREQARDQARTKEEKMNSANIDPLESVADVPVRRGAGARGRTASTVDGSNTSSVPSSSSSAAPTTVATSQPVSTSTGRDSSRLHILRRKLLDFLRTSTSYTAEKMLSRFPRHALLEERAILLSRINQHTQALNIYAHMLHDPLQAEAYAEGFHQQAMLAQQHANGVAGGAAGNEVSSTVSNGAIAQGRDMYLNLLQVYLKPPLPDPTDRSSVLQNGSADGAPSEPPAPMLDAALMLLSKYYDRIAPIGALESLPSETPLQALWPYFEKLLCHQNHKHRDEQITKQLLKTEYYSVKEEYLLASRGRVVCDASTTCGKCSKKIGNSALVRYPSGQVAHYSCHTYPTSNVKGDL